MARSFRRPNRAGPWQGKAPRQYTLQLQLNELALRKTHLRYGLGPVAFLPFAFGAPSRKVSLALDWRMELRDPEGRVVYERARQFARPFYDGWYYRRDAEQRALDEISFVLGDELDRLLAECAGTGSATHLGGGTEQ